MDAGALADEILEVVGVPVGLCWKMIDNGKKDVPKSQKLNALVVEVESSKRYTYQKELTSFYSRTTRPIEEYPNGIRMRFVKTYADTINTIEK